MGTDDKAEKTRGGWAVAAAVSLLVLLHVLFFAWTWPAIKDNAQYYLAARQLALGAGMISVNLPDPGPELRTPMGFPLLLAGVLRVAGDRPYAAQLFVAALHAAAAWLFFAWARGPGRLARRQALAVTAVGCCGVWTLIYSSYLMADIPYLAVSLLALWLLGRAPGRPAAGLFLLAGLVAGYGYLLRSVGLALVLAGVAYLAAARQWKAAGLFLAGALLCVLPWWLRNLRVAGVPDIYLLQSGTRGSTAAWELVGRNVRANLPGLILRVMPDALFYNLFGGRELLQHAAGAWAARVARWAVVALVGFGWLRSLRFRRVTELYWVLYWLLMAVFAVDASAVRYVIPILPLAALYLGEGLDQAVARVRRLQPVRPWLMPLAAAGVVGLALAAGVAHARQQAGGAGPPWAPARYLRSGHPYDAAFARYAEAALWMGGHTDPQAVVASRVPPFVTLLSGRRGWRYDLSDVPGTSVWDRVERMAAGGRPVLILEDAFPVSSSFGSCRVGVLEPLLAAQADWLELRWATAAPTTRVWQVRAAAAPAAEGAP